VIGKTTRIKAIYGTGKISGWYYQQTNEVIKDFEVNVQKKKEIRFINIFAETGDWQRALPTNRCYRHHRTQESDLEANKALTTMQR
jgi:hypothetical protein